MNILPLTSLPRSGSTLLMHILNQNPLFEIGPDSELANLLHHNKNFIENQIFYVQLSNEEATNCFTKFCEKGSEAWVTEIVGELNKNKIFVDKSRHWLKDLDYFFTIFPNIKIIITIRDIRGIINSFERINSSSLYVNRKSFHESLDFDLQKNRIDKILNMFYLKDGFFSLKELVDMPKKYINQIKICRYEDLIENPIKYIKEIYEFLNIEYYNHNLKSIQQKFFNDNVYQPYGCHRIKNKLTSDIDKSFSYLRKDIQDQIVSEYYWYYKFFYQDVI
jgi:hypothetical protein